MSMYIITLVALALSRSRSPAGQKSYQYNTKQKNSQTFGDSYVSFYSGGVETLMLIWATQKLFAHFEAANYALNVMPHKATAFGWFNARHLEKRRFDILNDNYATAYLYWLKKMSEG